MAHSIDMAPGAITSFDFISANDSCRAQHWLFLKDGRPTGGLLEVPEGTDLTTILRPEQLSTLRLIEAKDGTASLSWGDWAQ